MPAIALTVHELKARRFHSLCGAACSCLINSEITLLLTNVAAPDGEILVNRGLREGEEHHGTLMGTTCNENGPDTMQRINRLGLACSAVCFSSRLTSIVSGSVASVQSFVQL